MEGFDGNVRCDACGCAFPLDFETRVDGEIETTFFRCPFCGKGYVVCVTDEALRKNIREYQQLYTRNQKKRLSERTQKRLQKLKASNVKRCEELKKQYPLEEERTTYKFAKNLQRRFGIIPHVTDKKYITNSYHVHVTEEIDAFSKLGFEAEFQPLSPGGAISYVEVPNMQHNIPAVLSLMRFIYDNIMYAELNTKSDYCQVCGFDGEIQAVEDDGKLVWECPNCGNRDEKKLNVCRRVCGYLGVNAFNQGRMSEIAERVLHL